MSAGRRTVHELSALPASAARIPGRTRAGKLHMIRMSFGITSISGQFSGRPGLLRNRYRQLRRAHLKKDVRRSTSRKMTKSAASNTVAETPSITHASRAINAAILSARQSAGLFRQPGRHTISSKPKTGKSKRSPTCFASVVFPLPAFPVMKIRVMPTGYTSNHPNAANPKTATSASNTSRPVQPISGVYSGRLSPGIAGYSPSPGRAYGNVKAKKKPAVVSGGPLVGVEDRAARLRPLHAARLPALRMRRWKSRSTKRPRCYVQ